MRGLFTVLLLGLSALTVLADNTYPIVLVHGFAGWGRDELLGVKYWGGFQGDLEEQLKTEGYTVYTATVGPFSSNWDRACELYAQIKGGQVDYGKNHAAKHGHKQLGRTFPGLYPEWGNVVDGKVNKVHLVGHSMGGQTIRMLAQMLAHGTTSAPVEETPSSHPLFQGDKDGWVHSITTLATPNQGTVLANGFAEVGDAIKDFAVGLFSVIGAGGDTTARVFDAKLDQWGLASKSSSESLGAYVKRVFASPMFKPGFRDICIWSLSTPGAAEESTWVHTLPNIYYYSYSNIDTYSWRDFLFRKIQLPNLFTMLLPLQPLGIFLGGRFGPNHGISESWQGNDGVVNTASMVKDATGQSRTFDGSSTLGQWNVMPQLKKMDHLAVVGVTLHTQIKAMYVAHSKLLASLPVASSTRSLEESTASASADIASGIDSAINALNAATQSVETENDLLQLCANVTTGPALSYCATMELAQSSGRRLRA